MNIRPLVLHGLKACWDGDLFNRKPYLQSDLPALNQKTLHKMFVVCPFRVTVVLPCVCVRRTLQLKNKICTSPQWEIQNPMQLPPSLDLKLLTLFKMKCIEWH